MKQRVEKKTEDGDWSSKSSYMRDMIRAGESNIAEFDPRSGSNTDKTDEIDKMILDGLDTEIKEIDECLEPALNSLASRLDEMANNDEYQVERIPRKGYKLDK